LGSDEVFREGSHVSRVLEFLGDVFSEGFYSLQELFLVFALVETLENVTVHLFGIALKSKANKGCSSCVAAITVSATRLLLRPRPHAAPRQLAVLPLGIIEGDLTVSLMQQSHSWWSILGSENVDQKRTLSSTSVEKME